MWATVTDKGQLTVPKEIRDRYGIRPGAKLEFESSADGTLRVKVLARGPANLFGLLHRPGVTAKTIEQMDAAIADAVSARNKHLEPRHK